MRKLSLLSTLVVCGLTLLMVMPSFGGLYKYTSSPNVPLPDMGTVVDNIYVPLNLDVAEIRVGVKILHQYSYQVKITLRGPNGQSCVLKNANASFGYGSIGGEGVRCLFKKGGAGQTVNFAEPYGNRLETYDPSTSFDVFAGIRSQGWWTIIVQDGGSPYDGFFEAWDLFISGGNVIPPITLFTQDGSNVGYYSGNVFLPPVGTGGGGIAYGTNADIYRNFISGSGITIGTTGPGGRMTIDIDLIHTWAGDLEVYLRQTSVPAPPNPPAYSQSVVLSDNRGGSGDDMILTFDEMATQNITGFTGSFGSYSGRWKPEGLLSSLNGLPLDGYWWLSIYDNAGGDNGSLNSWSINYEVAGYNILTPLHEAIANPLEGQPIPAAITGALIGYVSDIVGTIPPYSVTSKLEQPTFGIWTNNKQFGKFAVGFEKNEWIDAGGSVIYTGYWGPYAYSVDGATYVNADIAMLSTEQKYRIRTTLSSRDDDDMNDNNASSGIFELTPATLSYAGGRITEFPIWNYYYPTAGWFNWSLNQSFGVAFTVFKWPTSRLTSVDVFSDSVAASTGVADTRIRVYRCATGFTGAPVGPPVAESPTLLGTNRHVENWYTYQIGPVGSGIGGVDLAPGTYVIAMQVVAGGPFNNYRYDFPMARVRKNGNIFASNWHANYGPILPSSIGTTKLFAYGTDNANPPTNSLTNWGSYTVGMRANFVTQNDFAIETITPRGSVNVSGAPFIPAVKFKSASPQNGLPQGFNGLVSIYNSYGTKVYSSEKTGTVAPYGTVDLSFNPWTPATPGDYKIECKFSRNPLDQNKVNDICIARLVVYQTGVGVVYDDNTPSDVIDATRSELAIQGVTNARFINRSQENLNLDNMNTIFWIGKTKAEESALLRSKIENGAQVAYVNRNSEFQNGLRTVLENVDKVFEIQREQPVNYDRVTLGDQIDPSLAQQESTPTPSASEPLQIKSKEDLLKYFMQSKRTLEQPVAPIINPKTIEEKAEIIARQNAAARPMAKVNPEEILYPVVNSPYGDIRFVNSVGKEVQFVFALPERMSKNSGLVITAAAPTGYSLGQNFPNPFNPSTVIGYSLPEASHVDLRVYDALGREVTKLISESQNAGRFNIVWKGQDNNGAVVSSGVFFYRLVASPVNGGESFISMKKMTLAK